VIGCHYVTTKNNLSLKQFIPKIFIILFRDLPFRSSTLVVRSKDKEGYWEFLGTVESDTFSAFDKNCCVTPVFYAERLKPGCGIIT
jgi:hypothetical protein